MLKTLAKVSCRQLNYFPAKNGVSPYFSPHVLMHKRNIDYHKHCTYSFGEYVQAYQEEQIKNNNKPHTLDCIYLEPTFKSTGGHYVMNIATDACMTKNRLWRVPITQTVINAVKSLAESQGYKSLKLLGKNKTRLLPSNWDKDEEYIFDDSYDSDDNDDDNNEEDNVDHFKEINEDEIKALHETTMTIITNIMNKKMREISNKQGYHNSICPLVLNNLKQLMVQMS